MPLRAAVPKNAAVPIAICPYPCSVPLPITGRHGTSGKVRLTLTYLFEIVISGRLFNFQALSYTDWKLCAIFQYAAVVLKFKDVIGIYGDSFVDGKEAGVPVSKLHEFRHGHAAAQLFPIYKTDVKVMCVRSDGGNLVKKYLDSFSVAYHLDIFLW